MLVRNQESGIRNSVSALLIALLILYPQNSVGEIITKCVISKGWSYYMYNPDPKYLPNTHKGDLVEEKLGGNGVFILEKTDSESTAYDVLYESDTAIKQESLHDNKAVDVFSINGVHNNIVVWTSNRSNGNVEHYTFDLDKYGNGSFTYMAAYTGVILPPKILLQSAKCTAP